MKAKPGRVVKVTVTSKLPEFQGKMVFGKLVDKGASWDAFLKNNWITLNDEEFCISALKGRVMATTKEKVAKVIDAYRVRMPEYKVQIVRKIPHESQGEDNHESGIILRARASLSKNKLTQRFFSQEEEPLDPDDIIDVEADAVNNDDDFVFTMPQARPRPRSHSGNRGWNDRINTASSAPRDTFCADTRKSIKEIAVGRLSSCATNGYVHRVREELLSLQATPKGLKVARYIPYTLNVLGVLFDTNAGVQ